MPREIISITQGERFDGRTSRARNEKKHIDYSNTLIAEMRNCKRAVSLHSERYYVPPHKRYERMIQSAILSQGNPSNAICLRRAGEVKDQTPDAVNVIKWMPTGNRVVTAQKNGNVLIWGGKAFNFLVKATLHNHPIRTMEWNHRGNRLLIGDNSGIMKLYNTQLTPKNELSVGNEMKAVRCVTWSPNDQYVAAGSDDTTVRIYDSRRFNEVLKIKGHHREVVCCDWHKDSSLLLTGDKNNLIRLWDVRAKERNPDGNHSSENIHTFQGHKGQVTVVRWNKNGNWFLSAARDNLLYLWDIRMMKSLQKFSGHDKHINAAAWHPFHEKLFVSGGFDGKMCYWIVGQDSMAAEYKRAHKMCIWHMDWHPLGHVLASCSKSGISRFWVRNKPGDTIHDDRNQDIHQDHEIMNPDDLDYD